MELVVCSTEQLETFRKDVKWKTLPKGSCVPYFKPIKDQTSKIMKLLEGSEMYNLTEDGFELVNK